MDNLEAERIRISNYINEKNANDLKTIINTYIESVFVYEDKVEINLILFFVHINGGGEAKPAP